MGAERSTKGVQSFCVADSGRRHFPGGRVLLAEQPPRRRALMQLRTKSSRPPRFSMAAILSLIASWSLSLVTTASLVAVGWLGHSTHWNFGLAGHAGARRQPCCVGATRHFAPEYLPDGRGRFGQQPPRKRLGSPDGRLDRAGLVKLPARRFYALGCCGTKKTQSDR